MINVAGHKYLQDAITEHVYLLTDARCQKVNRGEKGRFGNLFTLKSRGSILNIEISLSLL